MKRIRLSLCLDSEDQAELNDAVELISQAVEELCFRNEISVKEFVVKELNPNRKNYIVTTRGRMKGDTP